VFAQFGDFRAVFEGVHRAIFKAGSAGDVRHLGGWDRFV
jgi:hypothetical protein